MFILPDAKTAMGDTALQVHRTLLDKHKPRTAGRQFAHMLHMPICHKPIDGGVGGHRGHDDAVTHFKAAQRVGLKQDVQIGLCFRSVYVGHQDLLFECEGAAQRHRPGKTNNAVRKIGAFKAGNLLRG